MRVSKGLFIWGICYIFVFGYVLLEYRINASDSIAINETMLYLILTKPQKLLFNNSLFLVLLIFCTKKEFLEPMIFVRYQRRLPLEMIKRGLIICLGYVMTTIALVIIFGVIFNVDVILSFNLIIHFLYLFLFCLYVYFFYALLYLLFSNQVLAVLLSAGSNFLFIATIINIVWRFGVSETLVGNLLMLYLLVVTPLLMIAVIVTGRYKECL